MRVQPYEFLKHTCSTNICLNAIQIGWVFYPPIKGIASSASPQRRLLAMTPFLVSRQFKHTGIFIVFHRTFQEFYHCHCERSAAECGNPDQRSVIGTDATLPGPMLRNRFNSLSRRSKPFSYVLGVSAQTHPWYDDFSFFLTLKMEKFKPFLIYPNGGFVLQFAIENLIG